MVNTPVEIRKAVANDAASLYDLHKFWSGKSLLKRTFNINQLDRLILESEVAVAVHGGRVVSYYFINPFFETGNVEIRKAIIQNKILNVELPEGNYAISLQSATDENYTGRGLSRSTLNLLKDLGKDKYDYFIGIMDHQNVVTHKSSLKMGWKHFGDVGIGLLAVIAATSEKEEILGRF